MSAGAVGRAIEALQRSGHGLILSREIAEILAGAGLLVDLTCTRCVGTGQARDVDGRECQFCAGTGERGKEEPWLETSITREGLDGDSGVSPTRKR